MTPEVEGAACATPDTAPASEAGVVVRFQRRAKRSDPATTVIRLPSFEQVRDDPGQVLALAAGAPPRTVSTFTVWRSAQAMTDMVAGRSDGPGARRHVEAMAERRRVDFHREFTTLRFRCLEEHGTWQGRTGIVPTDGVPGA